MTFDGGRLGRRDFLKALGLAAASGGAGLASTLYARRGVAQAEAPKPRFLIVVAGAGGASIIDSFLAIRESEAGDRAERLNCFPDPEIELVRDSPFRAVALSDSSVGAIPIPYEADQRPFVQKRKDELMVATLTGTSVNHNIAQKRALTGNDAWSGRTLQEAVAAHYGAGMPLPNVNMSGAGYIEPGIDPTTPPWAIAEPVAEAALWPLSLHGARGIRGAPAPGRIGLARQLRDEKLDPESTFSRTFAESERLRLWREQRAAAPEIEREDLITRLNVFPDAPPNIPLRDYELAESPDGRKVRQAFPNFLTDPLEAQAALAFLLIKNRVSVTVTISPSFSVLLQTQSFPPEVINPPLAFDYSHNSHRAGQAVMWGRILSVADRLADLLAGEEFEAGESFWDRSMIYFATDFGRTKQRPGRTADFGTSHDLNNGFAFLSPLVNGGQVLGGVDPRTGLTYGFDPEDPQGVPRPGTHMEERQIYAGILHALGVPTEGSGLPDMRAMRRRA
jgi:hypothetical protein